MEKRWERAVHMSTSNGKIYKRRRRNRAANQRSHAGRKRTPDPADDLRCPPYFGQVCVSCQQAQGQVQCHTIGRKNFHNVNRGKQCIGSRPCLRCIETQTECSYPAPDVSDGCKGKNLIELRKSLADSKYDGPVPLVKKMAFAFMWCVTSRCDNRGSLT